MKWYNEIRFDIESEVDNPYDDEPLRSISYKCFKVTLKVVWTITDGIRSDSWRKVVYQAKNADSLGAIKDAFQDFLDKRVYNVETDYDKGIRDRWDDAPIDFKKLPVKLELSNHTPEVQEFIKQILFGTEHQN